ncbi:MAG TPA: bifunctional demethylmenaquinone methyltransferase/2-methoxy-6-polyprenyl-1,4-benzoquinol methylase UbiE [Bacteroidetes bacterium]|nr:bifunctional demethylmenaquinone methyltransferase/2-methoxy-6-polyprenyl-1,4-benzoquinol methylase UbiE [Bacteroidota bacterium]
MSNTVTPYQDKKRSKKEQVAEMFDNIAPRYDFLNHFLSMGIDIRWRRKAIRALQAYKPEVVLDIATGTGDFAIEALRLKPQPKEIIGLDISAGMLEVGQKKIEKKGFSEKIRMVLGDSEALPFEDNSIGGITVGFGVRNFENLEKGMGEILRVLKPGGAAVILEPAVPQRFPMKQLFGIYFRGILPMIGKLVSKDSRAYTYLPESVKAFPNGKDFVTICEKVGFRNCQSKPLSFGICAFYIIEK